LFLGVGLAKAPTQMDSICVSSVFTFAGGLLNSPLMGVVSLPFAVLGRAARASQFWGASAACDDGCPWRHGFTRTSKVLPVG